MKIFNRVYFHLFLLTLILGVMVFTLNLAPVRITNVSS